MQLMTSDWLSYYGILYNYPPERRGIYLALYTDPEGDSCFSIYQFSWIKIKRNLS